MSKYNLLFVLALVPAMAVAQQPAPKPGSDAPHATSPALHDGGQSMRAVLLANRPAQYTEAEWLRMMAQPVNRALYPLRVTPGMLVTLDARELDPHHQYIMDTPAKAKQHEDQ